MKSLLIATIFLACFSCNNTAVKDDPARARAGTDTANYTAIQWKDSAQNLGTLTLGSIAQIKFHFKNTGSKPLYIIGAEPGCGCTIADFPKQAVATGDEGEIVAAFNTKDHPGPFNKTITVTTNTKPNVNTTLLFTGEIKGNALGQ